MELPISEELFGDDYRFNGYLILEGEVLYDKIFAQIIEK